MMLHSRWSASRHLITACASTHGPRRLVSYTSSHSASASFSGALGRAIPALLISTSMGATNSTAATQARVASRSRTSSAYTSQRPPSARISAARSCILSALRATIATRAPARAKVRAKCRPSPLDAPVSKICLLLRSNSVAKNACCLDIPTLPRSRFHFWVPPPARPFGRHHPAGHRWSAQPPTARSTHSP